MDNKIKRTFVLLFVAATLLLMIGSVSAENAVELDENLEASIDSVDLSINEDESIIDLDISSPLPLSIPTILPRKIKINHI